MRVVVTIPTMKTYAEVAPMIKKIKMTTSVACDVIATCKRASASVNRNLALSGAEYGDIVIMVDDDIDGFFPGWDAQIIEPVLNGASMAAARLLTPDGKPGPQNGATDEMNDVFVYPAHLQIVPTAAVAFVKDELIFDENYLGAGWEDTDFCNQIRMKYPLQYIMVNNKCKLIHRYEGKHAGMDKVNAEYFSKKWQYFTSVECCIFSKDRPLQLELLLASIRDNASKYLNNKVNVLYTCSHPDYHKAYQAIFERHRNLNVIEERDFQSDVRNIVRGWSKKWCLFLCDDGYISKDVDISNLLDFNEDIVSFSLRLDPNKTWCTPAKKEMKVPDLQFLNGKNTWEWKKCDQFTDWGLPFSVDGNIFRTDDIKKIVMLKEFNPDGPNEMEVMLSSIGPKVTKGTRMACNNVAVYITVSANRVNESGQNPFEGESTSQLLQRMYHAEEIDRKEMYSIEKSDATNIFYPYSFKKPDVGIFFTDNGKMHGCWKVWNNTVRGLEMLGVKVLNNDHGTLNGCINPGGIRIDALRPSTVVGPETMVSPTEWTDLWNRFTHHVTPCEWSLESHKHYASISNTEIVWPCGIDTDRFIPSEKEKRIDVVVYWKNVVGQAPIEEVLEAERFLDKLGLRHARIEYGKYDERYLIDLAHESKCFLWMAGTESQNIALLEVLSMDVPVYVLDKTVLRHGDMVVDYATSAPYFSIDCGIKSEKLVMFERFFHFLRDLHPRDFVVRNFNLKKQALQYYRILLRSYHARLA